MISSQALHPTVLLSLRFAKTVAEPVIYMAKGGCAVKLMLRSALMILAIISFTPSYAAEISEASVMSLITEIDKAISIRDPERVGNLISEDADISGTITIAAVKRAFHMNKSQYMEALRAAGRRLMSTLTKETMSKFRSPVEKQLLRETSLKK